jgi:hypothetical protein
MHRCLSELSREAIDGALWESMPQWSRLEQLPLRFFRHYRCSVLFSLAYYVVSELTTKISSGQNCRLNRRLAGADPCNPCHNPPVARPT